MPGLSSQEAWKRTLFSEELAILKSRIKAYDDRELTKDALVNAVGVWYKRQMPNAKRYNPQLEDVLRMEWEQTEDIELFRKYADLGMDQRSMGRVCNVSASAISRWLRGTRTKKIRDPTLKELIERANR